MRDAKRLRRKLERRWRKTRSEPDREAYRYQCQVVRDELVKAKSEHYHNKLSEADNHKDVYSIANSLLFGPKVQKLPTHDSVQDLSEQFADYFIQKIVTIRNGLCQNINSDNQCDETDVISILGSLNPATNEEISKIIRSSASKSCDLDPIPTWLLKLCLSELMTSSNGNIFRVTGHFCGEFTGQRWIPRTKASDSELLFFLWSAPE